MSDFSRQDRDSSSHIRRLTSMQKRRGGFSETHNAPVPVPVRGNRLMICGFRQREKVDREDLQV
jgi:hypothetical protein